MTEKLSEERTRHEFDIELKNQFSALFDEASEMHADEIQRRSDALSLALEETCNKVFG